NLGEVRSVYSWSPDSKWLAYDAPDPKTLYTRIALYEVETGKNTVLTDAFGDCSWAAFSRDMKHLFFTATVQSGPTQFGLNMNAGAHRSGENSIYVAVLQQHGKNPLFPKSDEGVPSDDDKDKKGKGDDAGKDGAAGKGADAAGGDAKKDADKEAKDKDGKD